MRDRRIEYIMLWHLQVVRYLVSKGADIHKPNHNGGTCLINAVQNVELCQLLIDNGVDVNFKDSAGECVVDLLSSGECVVDLLSAGECVVDLFKIENSVLLSFCLETTKCLRF